MLFGFIARNKIPNILDIEITLLKVPDKYFIKPPSLLKHTTVSEILTKQILRWDNSKDFLILYIL